MTEIILSLETFNTNKKAANFNSRGNLMKWKAMAMLGFAGGFLLLIIGSFINLFGHLFETGLPAAEMSRVGTVLLVPAFPLLFLGAHALDKIYEEKKKSNAERTAFKRIK